MSSEWTLLGLTQSISLWLLCVPHLVSTFTLSALECSHILASSTAMYASTRTPFILTSQCYLLPNALKIIISFCLEVHSGSSCLWSLYSAWLDCQCTLLQGNRRNGVNSSLLLAHSDWPWTLSATECTQPYFISTASSVLHCVHTSSYHSFWVWVFTNLHQW